MGQQGPLRAALYCRVSTADQSCARQERDLAAFAARAGYEVVGTFKETGSGVKLDRAERQKVMAVRGWINIARPPYSDRMAWLGYAAARSVGEMPVGYAFDTVAQIALWTRCPNRIGAVLRGPPASKGRSDMPRPKLLDEEP